jgi:cytochrome c
MTRFCSTAALGCLAALLAGLASARAADAKKGKELFEKCAACHSLQANKNDDAPSLAGIFGRKAAAIEEFRYSSAMKQSNVTWDERTLDAFIEDPQAFIPGNRMPFDGLKDKPDREDLLAYLKEATKTSNSAQLHSRLIPQPTVLASHAALYGANEARKIPAKLNVSELPRGCAAVVFVNRKGEAAWLKQGPAA